MNENGFNVNTNINVKPEKRRKRKTKKAILRNPLIIGIGVLLVLILAALAFCKFVPVYEVTLLEKCLIVSPEGNSQINYYDLDERVVKREVYNNLNELENVTVCTYDDKGNILKEEVSYHNVLGNVIDYIYTGGSLTRMENKTPEGIMNSAVNYYYNADSTLTMKLYYDEQGNMVMQENYTYEGGKLINKSILFISNDYLESEAYTYNGEKLASMKITTPDSTTTVTYTYDNRGNVLTENSSRAGVTVYKYTYKTVKVSVFDRHR